MPSLPYDEDKFRERLKFEVTNNANVADLSAFVRALSHVIPGALERSSFLIVPGQHGIPTQHRVNKVDILSLAKTLRPMLVTEDGDLKQDWEQRLADI